MLEYYHFLCEKSAFENWQREQSELPEEILERRKQALNKVIKEVIDNELNEQEQVLAEMFWYNGIKQRKICSLLGLTPSYVSRHLQDIQKKVYRYMKYVVKYYRLAFEEIDVPEDM